MRKKLLCCLCLLALMFSGLAAAGETIRVLGLNTPLVEGMKALVPEFEKETGIKVIIEQFAEDQLTQKLAVELASGNTDLDVFVSRPLNEARMFKKNGYAIDLTPYFKDDADYDFDDFTVGAIESTRIDGYQTGIPMMNEVQLVFYRKDIFEERGLTPPDTFDELVEIAKELTDRDNGFYAILMRGQRSPPITQLSSFLYGFGGDWFDRKTMTATFDTPEALKAIDLYGTLLREYGPPGAPNMSWPQMQAIYQQGKGAMYIDASSHLPMLLDPTRSDIAKVTGVALFPAGPAGRKVFDITAWMLGIHSKSQKKDAAWKFIRFCSNKKNLAFIQNEFGVESSRKSAYETQGSSKFPQDWIKAVKDTAPYGVGYDRPLVVAVQEVRDILGDAIVTSIEGKDYVAAAKRANQKFQEILDREKAEAEAGDNK